MLLYAPFPLIWYATWLLIKVLTFDPTPGVEDVCRDKICLCMVFYAPFLLFWYATWSLFMLLIWEHIYSSSYIVFVVTTLRLCCQSKKEGKDQESIQSSTTPDQWYQWESDNVTIRHHKRKPRGQPFLSMWLKANYVYIYCDHLWINYIHIFLTRNCTVLRQ